MANSIGLEVTDAAPESAYRQIARIWKAAFSSELTRTCIPEISGAPVDLERAAGAAWRDHDRAAFIAAARALRSARALRPKHALRFARALLEADLLSECLSVVRQEAGASNLVDWAWLTALVQIRLGNFLEGAAALEHAAHRLEGEGQRPQVELLKRALQIRDGLIWESSWREASANAFALLELRLPELACAVLASFLEHEPEAAVAEVDPVLDCCFAVLSHASAEPGSRLLGAMAILYRTLGEQEALASAQAAMADASADLSSPPAADNSSVQALHNCLAAALAAGQCWRAAARRYVLTAQTFRRAPQIMCELSRCVGRDVASKVNLGYAPAADRPRVIDVFPFNGEFDMLALKLAAMGEWVDRFVIVEGALTFTGLPKPLSYPARASEFSDFSQKITYVPVDSFPPYLTSAWAREFYQRDQAIIGLQQKCSPDDVIVISDVDEIVRHGAPGSFDGPLSGADLQTLLYFLNYEHLLPRPNVKTVFARARLLQQYGCSYLRIAARQLMKRVYVSDAGWHFSNIGSPEALEWKFRSFSHQEWGHLDQQHFEAIIDQAKRVGLGSDFQRLDPDDLPEFIKGRRDELARWLL